MRSRGYQKNIAAMKVLRRVYKFIVTYGTFNTEYEGEVQEVGDIVFIRPTSDIRKGVHPYRTLTIDSVVPNSILCAGPTWDLKTLEDQVEDFSKVCIRYLMGTLDWESPGDLVVAYVDNVGIVWGYNEEEIYERL